ncbi:MAG: trimethylamine methyltransferase family protein [Anaerolineae bacterium]
MITGTLRLFSESDLDRLHEATLKVLEGTGMQVLSGRLLDALERSGARVDRAQHTVRYPRALVEALVAERRQRPWQPPREATEAPRELALGLSGVIAPFIYDYAAKARRPATQADLLDTIHWAEVDLSPQREVDLAVTMGEVPPIIEPIVAYELLLEHTTRPGRAYTTEPVQIPYLVELAEIYYGRPVFPRGTDFVTSPLTISSRLAEHTLAAIRAGQTHFPCGVMPICGGNAPITVAGNVVQSAAEMLGLWLAIRAVCPQATFSGGACNGIVDLRKGTPSFNAPEALLADLGVCELFRRRYGGDVHVAAFSDYIDAALPGIQAAYERTYRAMAIAAFVGDHFQLGGQGTLDAGQIFSPEQFILERDMSEGLVRLGQGIAVSEETIALETIQQVGAGEGKSFLDTEHTLRHFRETWFPRYLYRGVYQDDAAEHARDAQMLSAAHEHYRACIARYQPPKLDEGKVRAMRAVVERARRDLVR